MMFTLEVADYSSSTFVTMWKEQAERFLGLSAEKLAELKDDDPDQYNSVLDAMIFLPFEFRVAIKQETYTDEERLRWTVNNVQPLMPSKLIGLCQKMLNAKNNEMN